nr:hypothetical protein [Methanobacterium formicicum]
MNNSCEYCQIDGGYGELIGETTHWMVYLAPSQRYLGTCVVALKRHCNNLSQVSNEEWTDFARVVQKNGRITGTDIPAHLIQLELL